MEIEIPGSLVVVVVAIVAVTVLALCGVIH